MTQSSVYQDNKHHVCLELMKGEVADAVLEAIRESNSDVKLSNLPGFLVIEVPERLRIDAESVRDHLGKSDWLMTDLNEIMAAFAGQIETYTEHQFVLSRLTI
jgi:hypothetical protein